MSSLLCGTDPSLGLPIIFRILQGVGGGGLQPMAQAILADVFPPVKRGLAFALQVHPVMLSQHTTPLDPSLQNEVKALGLRLVHSGASVADVPKLTCDLIYRFVAGQAVTLAYINTFIVLAIAAGIMFLMSFIVRKNDPKAGGRSGCWIAKVTWRGLLK